MKQDQYIKERLDDQLNWYDKKSIVCQRKFKLIRTMEIVFAALIPLLSALPHELDQYGLVKFIMAALGSGIIILAGINAINKYSELWTSYRTVAETLKHHKFLFETQSSPYAKDDAFAKLVENVESFISRENTNWKSMLKKQKQNTSNK